MASIEEDANRAGEPLQQEATAIETKQVPEGALPVAADTFGSNESFAALVVSIILSVYYLPFSTGLVKLHTYAGKS